jgi:hypothetical protein
MFHVGRIDTIKTVYIAYFHSVMKYRVIWGVMQQYNNKCDSKKKKKIFYLTKENCEINSFMQLSKR